ncbi:MAG: phytanoyl-CoA dioxygenase family protein [Candidatus Hydrogenedentes bacterium]|nr:phytanoyl-CoA dioxygenase family protein [Candidatus Hydrogenedentota bacterium]
MEDFSEARRQFERDGYVVFSNVLDADLIQEARDHVAWLLQKHPDLRPEHLHHTLMTEDAFWVRLVSDDRLLDRVEAFVGSNIALFASHYISKPPHDGMAVLWHQDGSYWPLEPMEVVTFWLAVDDSTPENGCMRVIPGTQHLNLQELKQRRDRPNVLNSGMDDALVDESRAADVILRAGDVSVHHPNVIHGSNPNTSAKWRRGLTIRYIPTSTRIKCEGIHPSAFLLRGKALPGINQYNPRPRFVEGKSIPFRGCEKWK